MNSINQNYRNKCSIICLKCNTIPFLTIIPNLPLKVDHLCQCSSQTYFLKDYLNYLYIMNRTNYSLTFYCQSLLSHSNIRASGYCTRCDEYLCKDCLELHQWVNRSDYLIVKYKYLYQKCIRYEKHYEYNFCINCLKMYCPDCDSSHNYHENFTQNDIYYIKIENINKSILNTQKLYRSLLRNTFEQSKSKNFGNTQNSNAALY